MADMMKVKYLSHSGFLLETEKAYYLFDYIKGKLPGFTKEKPLYVFSSHSHDDHFSRLIFEEPVALAVKKYILSSDIDIATFGGEKNFPKELPDKILWADARREYVLQDGIIVKTLRSTDLGVAFVVEENEGVRIYHAGDLNWWHWEGEPDPWNPDMEQAYKEEIGYLVQLVKKPGNDCELTGNDCKLDVAFVPLDPRLDNAYWLGLGYLLKCVKVKNVFPMHVWGNYRIIGKYMNEHPAENDTTIHMIEMEGETYEI